MEIKAKNLLDSIEKENDIKNVNPSEYEALAAQIRELLIEVVSNTGGHLASNLGVVELTMALHLLLTFPEDKLIFDVGHQSYVHKILTGRMEEFKGLRSFGGLSGFPKRRESLCDAFGTGHSSTALSAALGYAAGRERLSENYRIAAVIGDGAATGGLFYEAFNNLTAVSGNLVLVLNDNAMSIAPNVGAVAEYLKGGKEDGFLSAFFNRIHLDYLGPVDGHAIDELLPALREAFGKAGPVLVHVKTVKGKGYPPAEENPVFYHGIGKNAFAPEKEDSYTDVFGKTMLAMAKSNKEVAAVTAAMEQGVGLAGFHEAYPERFYDVGIAEGHAVTFAAGMAAGGLKPYVAVYSSFLQRAFDQILHDVCLQSLPVVFCIDRAGIVGEDGETHQGVFDLSYLSMIPGMTVAAAGDAWDLSQLLLWSLQFPFPLAIRYPKGEAYRLPVKNRKRIRFGKSETVVCGKDIAVLAVGGMLKEAVEIYGLLLEKGYHITVINVRFVKPFDKSMLFRLTGTHKLLVTLEENVLCGGYGQQAADYLTGSGSGVHVLNIGIQDSFIMHGTVKEIKKKTGMDKENLVQRIMKEYECCQ